MTTLAEPTTGRRVSLGPWRLEWLRLIRTPRAICLAAVYVFLGLLGPLTARYLSQILSHAGATGNLTITVAPPRPVDGISAFTGQANQAGLIVVVVVTAGALAFDARRGISVFLRTRSANVTSLLIPRFAVSAAAAIVAYTLGMLAAWYETAVLIGKLPATDMLTGWLCTAAYLVFAVAVTALAASLVRSVLATVGTSLGILFLLPLVGSVPGARPWLPTSLAGAQVTTLAGDGWNEYLRALAVTALVVALLVRAALRLLTTREV